MMLTAAPALGHVEHPHNVTDIDAVTAERA